MGYEGVYFTRTCFPDVDLLSFALKKRGNYVSLTCIKKTYFLRVQLKQTKIFSNTIYTLYTVDATEYITAQTDTTFHEGRWKWRALS